MLHSARISVAAFLLAALASTALGQTTMAYRFKEGETLHYLLEQKNVTKMSIAGADVTMNVNTTVSLAWHVLKVDSKGNATVKVRVTHSKMSMDSLVGNVNVDSKDKEIPKDAIGGPLGSLNKAIAAMEMTGTMAPTGAMTDVKISEETVNAMKAVPGADKLGDLASPDNFKDMVAGIVFPATAIEKGKTWSNKTETNTPAGKISAENVYALDGTVEKDGATLDKITLTPNITVVPNPKAEMQFKAIKGAGHTLFDNKLGRIVETVSKQTKTGTVSVMGLTLNQTTEETTTRRLQKPSEVKVEAAKTLTAVKIDEDKFVEKVVATELLETLAGVSRSFTLERSYEPAITLAGKTADKALADEIKAMVETSLGITFGKKATVKETITLDGKETTKINVQWVERSREGVALRADGSSVSFLVRVGMRIKLEKAK